MSDLPYTAQILYECMVKEFHDILNEGIWSQPWLDSFALISGCIIMGWKLVVGLVELSLVLPQVFKGFEATGICVSLNLGSYINLEALLLSYPQKKVKERRMREEGKRGGKRGGCKFKFSGKACEKRESEFYQGDFGTFG